MENMQLKNKSFDREKLKKFGFSKKEDCLFYSTLVLDNEFLLEIYILSENTYKTKLIEVEGGEEYVLYHNPNAGGAFVGRVREEIDKVLGEVVKNCTKADVFSSAQSHNVIEYVKKVYNRELEFLWDSLPLAAIWRRSDNQKWFGVMMSVPINRLGLDGEEIVDIVNVRADANSIIDNEYVFPAYHMNKKSWVSVLLNKGLNDEKLLKLIDESFVLALGKKKKVLV